jgi:hypothetical protein
MNYQQFYIAVGKLMYAASAIDGNVQPIEIKKFQQIVSSELAPLEASTDEQGSDAAFLAEFQYDTLLEINALPQDCYQAFLEFFKSHKKEINMDLRNSLLKMASSITASFNGKNKSELIFLVNLKRDLELENITNEQ